jgi:hypothetical protein
MQDPWMQAMLRGDFAAAWSVSDTIQQQRRSCGEICTHWPRHQQFIWDGTPLDGKRLLVRCYHGLGDTIQFVRLLPLLRPRVQRITLWVQPQLLRLLTHIDGVDELLPLHDGAPQAQYDADIELMEIPHALRLQISDIPRQVPYIRVPTLDPGPRNSLRIGLATSAGEWNPQRSIPPEVLRPLASLSDARWFSLQFPKAQPPFAMPCLSCTDITAMAARMRTLDLIISVDTMHAHLAGALGIGTWLLLQRAPDWRWMSERTDSPWYPTMRLFRQQRSDDWTQVIEQVSQELRTLIRARDIHSAGCTTS